MNVSICNITFLVFAAFFMLQCKSLDNVLVQEKEVGIGWSSNSINTVIFRQNAVTTYKNTQFTAYYDADSYLVLAKRELPLGNWEIHKTQYTGNTADAHNAISIAVDGKGFLHLSWDHHDNELRYAQSVTPFSLELTEKKQMTGIEEERVSYPQFYNLNDSGNLIFMYRSGQSGRGILVIKSYDVKTGNWSQLHKNLIDGEGDRNAYWQAYVDKQGTIHLSWVWRETWGVETNHDIAYAKSIDGGVSWQKSNGEQYTLPITEKTAEYAWKIPQNSSLINQTSMTTDKEGNPYIANYWNENQTTQYQIVYLENGIWKKENTAFRTTGFELGGGGTKKIPISRPEIFIKEKAGSKTAYLLFRDDLRESKISLAYKNLQKDKVWKVIDLTQESVGDWEPNFDKELFKKTGKLHIFKQNVIQVDGEGLLQNKPTPVEILELNTIPSK